MKLRIWISVLLTIMGFSVISWFILRGFFFENFIDINEKINLDKSAKFGDFIGGFVGAIFSFIGIILLFETLSLQRREFSDSKGVFVKQQFDNTFFDLLSLHKENVSNFKTYDLLGNELRGHAFFTYQKEFLQNSFIPTNRLAVNRKLAVESFRTIYLQFEDDFSIYFRTLYQLYSLINKSEIKGLDQASYSKILRAQLSEAELFFIRYNAMTEAGKQSIDYINLFNILKHLSIFQLLEFKYWWSQLNNYEKNGLGTIFKEIKADLKDFLQEEDLIKRISFKRGKYNIKLETIGNYEFKIELVIDNLINPPGFYSINGLDRFNFTDKENLFTYLIKELIISSNFNRFNIRREIDFSTVSNNPTIITVSAKNIYALRLKVHYWL